MLKLYQNLFVILATYPYLTFADLDDAICVDCKSVTGDDCKITDTGHQCYPGKKGHKFYDEEANDTDFDDDPPETYDLDVCIPDSVNIKSTINYCCVWSPELGCQYLRGPRVRKTALECVRCTIHDLNTPDQPVCPCARDLAYQMCVSALVLVVGVILVL